MATSSLTFSTAYQEVAGQLGLDYTDTDTLTRLKRWLNLGYKDVVGFNEWSWLRSREAVVMQPDYTTGTVSVTAGSATLTFSAVIATSRAGWYVQFSSADDWYEITAHTAGTDTATISPSYAQTSDLTAGTFILRKMYYALSTNVEYIESCKQAITNTDVEIVSAQEFDKYGFPTDTATYVSSIVVWGKDGTTGAYTFTPFPTPSAPLLLEFRSVVAITELSADSSVAVFPPRFDSIWLNRAKMYGYEFLNDADMYKLKFNETNETLKFMKRKDEIGRSQQHILGSVDGGSNPTGGIIKYPSNY